MKPGAQARMTAAELVGRIDREGAWSNVVLRDLEITGDDARLVRHLVYGTTRNRARIDRAISDLASRPFGSINRTVVDVLRVAFHEVLFGRAPSHAVTDSAVEAVRGLGQANASGFVNALVRALQRSGEQNPPADLATEYGLGEWLVDDLAIAWGSEATRAFVEQSHQDAPVGLRLRSPEVPVTEGMRETGIPGALYAEGVDIPDGTAVQDPASVAVVVALGAQPGELVLEVGAAPGGKSLALDDQGARVVAVDVHQQRTATARARTTSKGFSGYWIRADGRTLPFVREQFDRVLLDAPCTGLGTLRRRPEIRFKVTKGERDRLAVLQRELLEAALEMVRPGGRLVYAVCTVTPEETVDVVAGHSPRAPELLPGMKFDEGLLMAPHLTGTDGMFISVMDR